MSCFVRLVRLGRPALCAGGAPGGGAPPVQAVQRLRPDMPFELRALEVVLDFVRGSSCARLFGCEPMLGLSEPGQCGSPVLSGWPPRLPLCVKVTQYMEVLTADLEAAAHPALDNLTEKITTKRLDRVRSIKSRMVRLTTRVETVLFLDFSMVACCPDVDQIRTMLSCNKLKGSRS